MRSPTLTEKLLEHTVRPSGENGLEGHTPQEIRLACQDLVSQGHDSLAIAVGEAAYALYPADPEILVISALLSVLTQDWGLAVERLSELVLIQGVQVKEFTYLMLIRSQRCDLDPNGAIKTATKALSVYPESEAILKEYRELLDHGLTAEAIATQQ